MITIQQVATMSRDQLRELLPRLHEQHDAIAYQDKEVFYRAYAYSQTLPVHPKFPWPDLPTDKHQIDVMIISCLERIGADVLHISEVMEEYLTTLETRATLNEGGPQHLTEEQ